MRERNNWNLDLIDWNFLEGPMEVPALWAENELNVQRLTGFHQVLSFRGKKETVGVHFYLDDYQFERVWNRPALYLNALKDFECVLAPDFSMFLGMPKALMIWNHYRKMTIAHFWQNQGLKVIPTLNWAGPESWEFCFDGVPKKGCVSVSTLGVMADKNARKRWIAGMNEAVKRLTPIRILAYGSPIEFDAKNAEVVWFLPEHIQRMRNGKGKTKKVGPRTKWLMENEEAVMSIARRFGIPRQDWEDFRQETLLRSLTCKDDYQPEKAKIQTWAGNFTAFIARNWLKKRNAENKTKSVDFRDSDAHSSFGE